MFLEFYGAADGVTGSLHRLNVQGRDIALDCGLFQGRRAESNRLNQEIPDWARSAHALVLSHAHIDHSGNLPGLVKHGFTGNIYCTPPTRDLCSVMLRDAAMLQEQDARYINRRNEKEGIDERVEPLYDMDDAQQAMQQMITVPLHRSLEVAPGVTVTFYNAGHVLGSALVVLDISEKGASRRVLFTGDLGRAELPLLQNPELVDDVNVLITESTYGDRSHPDIETVNESLGEIIRDTIERKGRVYIPAFALERAQEVLFALEMLHEAGKLPSVPIYIDSPMAIAITEIYKLHPECLAEGVRKRLLARDDPFSPPGLRYVSEVADSAALQKSGEPCIVVAGSGMCEGGRIVFHLRRGLEDARNSVIIVGFMAQHTLGRRLVEKRRQVRVLGVEHEVRARIHSFGGLSAHADREDLVDFAEQIARQGRVTDIVLVHGEDEARDVLSAAMQERIPGTNVVRATKGMRLDL